MNDLTIFTPKGTKVVLSFDGLFVRADVMDGKCVAKAVLARTSALGDHLQIASNIAVLAPADVAAVKEFFAAAQKEIKDRAAAHFQTEAGKTEQFHADMQRRMYARNSSH